MELGPYSRSTRRKPTDRRDGVNDNTVIKHIRKYNSPTANFSMTEHKIYRSNKKLGAICSVCFGLRERPDCLHNPPGRKKKTKSVGKVQSLGHGDVAVTRGRHGQPRTLRAATLIVIISFERTPKLILRRESVYQ